MSKKTIEIITCDMCGDEIDLNDEWTNRNSVVCNSTYCVPVRFHNPSYDEGCQDGISIERLDLCPRCADRAATIHLEVTPVDSGRSCHHEYTWRER